MEVLRSHWKSEMVFLVYSAGGRSAPTHYIHPSSCSLLRPSAQPSPPSISAPAGLVRQCNHHRELTPHLEFSFLPLPSSTSNSIKIMSGVVVLVCGAKPIQIHWKPGGWLGTHPELAIFLQLYSLSCTYFFVTNLTENSRQQF